MGQVTRDQVVGAAMGWLDTPYQHGQCVRGVGCDCIGLVIGVASELGMIADLEYDAWWQRYRGYGKVPDPVTMDRALADFMFRVSVVDAGPGDVLWFRMRQNTEPQHLGIIMPGGYMVHATHRGSKRADAGVKYHRLVGFYTVSAWRYPNLVV